jgi:hypothetical protein
LCKFTFGWACRRCPTQVGDKVRFALSNVFLPSQEAVLAPLPRETELEGTVVDFSDSGANLRVFAVVDVVRKQAVVVPVEKLEIIMPAEPESKP